MGVAITLSPAITPGTEQSARPSARGFIEPKLILLHVAKIILETPAILSAVTASFANFGVVTAPSVISLVVTFGFTWAYVGSK